MCEQNYAIMRLECYIKCAFVLCFNGDIFIYRQELETKYNMDGCLQDRLQFS